MLGVVLANVSLGVFILNKSKSVSWVTLIWGFSLVRLISIFQLYSPLHTWEIINSYIAQDSISLILVFLTFWISLIIIIASQNSVKLSNNSPKLFSFFLLMLNLVLVTTFSVTRIIHFYFMFEASLIPILFIILGWGYQPERLQAGIYIIIYTVAASLPLLLRIMWGGQKFLSFNTFIITLLREKVILTSFSWTCNLLTLIIFTAFLVKLPMFSIHLWLPKAHVEAPVAGSMVLAAILLKLGGYGIFRAYQFFNLHTNTVFITIFALAIWGGTLTRIVCFRQVDFKSLIAYSSIGHMSLMLAGAFSNCSWGWNGALVLIISHGFCSSALFALANYTYEKTHTRSLFLRKGILLLVPILAIWWFIFCVINIAAPPRINLLGEIMIFPSVIFSSKYFLLPLGLIRFFAALYSIYLYTASQHGGSPKYIKPFTTLKNTSFTLLLLHWLPANFFILKSELVFLWV